jgi:hypothetical protein
MMLMVVPMLGFTAADYVGSGGRILHEEHTFFVQHEHLTSTRPKLGRGGTGGMAMRAAEWVLLLLLLPTVTASANRHEAMVSGVVGNVNL